MGNCYTAILHIKVCYISPVLQFLVYIIIAGLALMSFAFRKLTLMAAITAFMVAICIFWGSAFSGLAMLGAFFILGTTATSWHNRDKKALKPLADRGNRRDTWQVLANGGVAAICGLLAYIPTFIAQRQVFCLMMAGSLASAMADTLSSELGMVYGRRFYNIFSFKPDKKGLDGVISMEGTMIGLIGSAIIALIYCLFWGFSGKFWVIVIAGTVGNYIDSLLGATLERRYLLNNNMVNFFNTLTGALVVLALNTI